MSQTERPPATIVDIDRNATRRDGLARRLDDGYRRIDEARVNGVDVTAWETFWCELLGDYERLCDELDRAA